MIIVSDTSPLNYLILIQADHLLPALFGEVIAPPSVIEELARIQSPPRVREWANSPPNWLQIRKPLSVESTLNLGKGELEAIALALEMKADRVLLDDAKARQLAISRGLRVAGILAVLAESSERGLIDFRRAIDQLRQTTFYLDETLVESLLARLSKHGPKSTPGG